MVYFKKAVAYTFIISMLVLSGCASFSSQKENDPLETMNRGIFKFNEKADEYVLEPVAKGYQYVTPAPVDRGITRFFSNLDDVVVFVNDILQLKFKQAASDGGRFVVNTTVGLLGFLDFATDMGMPKHNEDFGQTLGFYGVGTGPYIVLPIMGASNLRDATSWYVEGVYVNPIFQIDNHRLMWAVASLKVIDARADLIDLKKIVDDAALDPYEFMRSLHFQRREYLVYDGDPPFDDDDLFDDDEYEDEE